MVESGLAWTKCSDQLGLSRKVASRALQKPHVRKFLIDERRAALDLAVGGNVAALVKERSESENSMARIAAVRTLEYMHADAHSPAQYRQGIATQPGLVIQIVAAAPQPPRVIDHTPPLPAIEHERTPVDR
jgi:hypothetical protein